MTAPQADTLQGPAGFREVQGREPTGPRVDREAITGVIVEYRGTRRFQRRDKTGDTVMHTMLNRGGKGKRFSLYGTADLDGKLRNVKPGAIIWLLYAGRKVVDGQERHVWMVSEAGRKTRDEIAELVANREAESAVLDSAIDAAAADFAARSQQSGEGAPDWDRDFSDDEVPF